MVYCHDVEFVTPEEVLTAITELRQIRDQTGQIKYIGISGYPVTVLCDLAEMVLDRTGEPLDAVMSYATFTLQNTRLSSVGLPRLEAAGVDVVPNASVLGMGLLRRTGVPIGARGDFHPSPIELRQAIQRASDWCDARENRIEKVAIRFALETWMRVGESVGSNGDPASGIPYQPGEFGQDAAKLGVSVMGVSNIEELNETMRVWRSILDGSENGEQTAVESGRGSKDRVWSLKRQKQIQELTQGIRDILGGYLDFTWASPPPDFKKRGLASISAPSLPTPAASPDQLALKLPTEESMDITCSDEI